MKKRKRKKLASIEDSVVTLIRRLKDNIKNIKERLITVNRNSPDKKIHRTTKMARKTTVWIFQATN